MHLISIVLRNEGKGVQEAIMMEKVEDRDTVAILCYS
jgi:hypothetical protein